MPMPMPRGRVAAWPRETRIPPVEQFQVGSKKGAGSTSLTAVYRACTAERVSRGGCYGRLLWAVAMGGCYGRLLWADVFRTSGTGCWAAHRNP